MADPLLHSNSMTYSLRADNGAAPQAWMGTTPFLKPYYAKAKKAIDAVAKENGYRYALDTSTGLVLYSEPSDDIIGLVIKKLGITNPQSMIQQTPPKK